MSNICYYGVFFHELNDFWYLYTTKDDHFCSINVLLNIGIFFHQNMREVCNFGTGLFLEFALACQKYALSSKLWSAQSKAFLK